MNLAHPGLSPASVPSDLSPGQRRLGVVFVVLLHALAAVQVVRMSRESVSASEAAPLMVSMITEAAAPQVSEPAPQPERAVTQPRPPAQTAPQRVAPPILSSNRPAQPQDVQVAAAAPDPRPNQVTAPVAPEPAAAPAAQTAANPGPVTEAASPPPQPKTLPSSAVRYLVKPQVVYPPVSQELGEAGTVQLLVLVDETGRTKDIQLVKSSGYTRLDKAAMAAMRAARFQPHLENGVPRSVWAPASINFNWNER